MHEDTRIVVRGVANGGTATKYIEVTSADQIPELGTDDTEENAGIAVDPLQAATLQGFLNEIQNTTCLPYASVKAIYFAFSSPKQATIEVTWRLGTDVIPQRLGLTHNLTNLTATTFSSFTWARACIVSMDVSWGQGTVTVKYFLPDESLF